MERIVRTEIINDWITENGPYGQERLSINARVSYPTVGHVRRGKAPARTHIRRAIAQAIGVTEDELFPVLAHGEDQAS